MFDILLSKVLKHRKQNSDEELISSNFELVKESDTLYILISPWHVDIDFFRIVRRKIKTSGASVVEYKFGSAMLSADIKNTRELFKEARSGASTEIAELYERHKFSSAVIVGVSLGCIEALMIANNNPLIDRILLIVPGSSLAGSLWEGLRTQNLRKEMEQSGIDKDVLEREWAELAPKNNISKIQGKKISVLLSRADKVIPYHLGEELVKDMNSLGLNPGVKINSRMGHYGTTLKFYLFPEMSGLFED